jgi:2-hydroxychromene-2-carboxylate isomerase
LHRTRYLFAKLPFLRYNFFVAKKIDFYFDVLSPFSWLAATQSEKFEKEMNIEFNFIPILLGAILNHFEAKGPAEIPVKKAYTFNDVLRWCSIYKLDFVGPPTHPFNPLLALRVCTACEEGPKRNLLARELMNETWLRGTAIDTEEGVGIVIKKLGMDAAALFAQAQSPEIKEKLKQNTAAAIEKGIFGVPTFSDGKNFFWGNDRMQMLKLHLKGELEIDQEKLSSYLNRPASVLRK